MLSSSRPHADFTEVAEEHFGKMAGRLISALYFLSIFPILLIYGVGLTNTVESFMVNQLGMATPDRVMLSGVLVFAMIAVMLAGRKRCCAPSPLWSIRWRPFWRPSPATSFLSGNGRK